MADDDIERAVGVTPQGFDTDDEHEAVEEEGVEFLPPIASQTKGRKNNPDLKVHLRKLWVLSLTKNVQFAALKPTTISAITIECLGFLSLKSK